MRPERAHERVYRTRALVLKRRDQGEADRVVTVFTPGMGKLALVARGVRKPASRKAGHLEPFTHVDLLVARSRSWDLITQAETVTSFRGLREDLDRAAHGYYVVEMIDAFTQEGDSQPDVFDLALTALRHLEVSSQLALTARWFDLALLRLSGYQPQLFHCVQCSQALAPVTNYFSTARGGMLCPRHGEGQHGTEALDVGALKVLRYLQMQPHESIVQLDLTPARMRQIEKLLADYIRLTVERRLQSPDFIREVREAG